MKDFRFISSNHLLITILVIFCCNNVSNSLDDSKFSKISSNNDNTAISLRETDASEARTCPNCVSGECDTAVQLSGLPIIQLIVASVIGLIWAAIFIWLYASFYESGGEGYGKGPSNGWGPSPVYGPPAPVYGPPAPVYGPPPMPSYGPPPAPAYGPPPAPAYGPPPAPTYGPPPAPVYGPPPAPSYGPPPAPVYGPPPSPSYGPPTAPSYSAALPVYETHITSYSAPTTQYQGPGGTGAGQLKPPLKRASLASTYSRVADSLDSSRIKKKQ